jgi:hypothetical protein
MSKSKIHDDKVKILVDEIFNLVENLDINIEPSKQIDEIFKKYPFLIQKRPNTTKFPRLKFNLELNDIDNLIENKLIDKNNKINLEFFKIENLTPLEKILYSVLWKQGDLGKEKHIISGVLNSSQVDDGLVFYYFGQHLQNKIENPIVDQHVIRAFRIKECHEFENIKNIRTKDFNIRKKGLIDKKIIIQNYLNWHKKIRIKREKNQQEDLTYNLDLLFFALGKFIKN